MSRHEFTIVFDVDDDELAAEVARNGGNGYPCTAEIDYWLPVDLFAAAHAGIVDRYGADFTGYTYLGDGDDGD